jgi:CheY-like chemotaxis protein
MKAIRRHVRVVLQGFQTGSVESWSSSSLARGCPVNILVAEDEFLITLTLKAQLEAMGHRVIGMPRDGQAAVDMAKEMKPDIVLMDIGMPGLDGIAATAQIMAEAPMPVIMLTAYNDRQRVQDAIRAGAVAYLLKPVNEAQLRRAIDDTAARFSQGWPKSPSK